MLSHLSHLVVGQQACTPGADCSDNDAANVNLLQVGYSMTAKQLEPQNGDSGSPPGSNDDPCFKACQQPDEADGVRCYEIQEPHLEPACEKCAQCHQKQDPCFDVCDVHKEGGQCHTCMDAKMATEDPCYASCSTDSFDESACHQCHADQDPCYTSCSADPYDELAELACMQCHADQDPCSEFYNSVEDYEKCMKKVLQKEDPCFESCAQEGDDEKHCYLDWNMDKCKKCDKCHMEPCYDDCSYEKCETCHMERLEKEDPCWNACDVGGDHCYEVWDEAACAPCRLCHEEAQGGNGGNGKNGGTGGHGENGGNGATGNGGNVGTAGNGGNGANGFTGNSGNDGSGNGEQGTTNGQTLTMFAFKHKMKKAHHHTMPAKIAKKLAHKHKMSKLLKKAFKGKTFRK